MVLKSGQCVCVKLNANYILMYVDERAVDKRQSWYQLTIVYWLTEIDLI